MDQTKCERYLLSLPEAILDYPFGPDVQVFKLSEKMFAALSFGNDRQHYWLNLKCNPDEAEFLRSMFDAIKPGYHMNKRHWNTVILDGSVPPGELKRMMTQSYRLVFAGLRLKQRQSLKIRHGSAVFEGVD